MTLRSIDFESIASANSAIPAYLILFFIYSFPIPDLRYFSLILAFCLVLNISIDNFSNGA